MIDLSPPPLPPPPSTPSTLLTIFIIGAPQGAKHSQVLGTVLSHEVTVLVFTYVYTKNIQTTELYTKVQYMGHPLPK